MGEETEQDGERAEEDGEIPRERREMRGGSWEHGGKGQGKTRGNWEKCTVWGQIKKGDLVKKKK